MMRKYIISTSAFNARIASTLGKGHNSFEEALDERNKLPKHQHNRYGIFMVTQGGSDARLATAQ